MIMQPELVQKVMSGLLQTKWKQKVFFLFSLIFILTAPCFSEEPTSYSPKVLDGPGINEVVLKSTVLVSKGQKFVAGERVNFKLNLRNATSDQDRNLTPTAVVIRSVRWQYGTPENNFRTQLPGEVQENQNGTIRFITTGLEPTKISFEKALLRPGEEKEIELPLTIQPHTTHGLVVECILLDAEKWKNEVLIEEYISPKSPGKVVVDFYPAAQFHSEKRGSLAIWDKTKNPKAQEGIAIKTLQFEFEFPEDARTGVLNVKDAARRAGIDIVNESYLTFYKLPMKAWFFVRDDNRAVALKQIDEDWKYIELPKMDERVVDEFGAYGENMTRVLLSSKARKGLLLKHKAQDPIIPNGFLVNTEDLWQLLERAREQKIDLTLAVANPTDTNPERAVSFGVQVDAHGVWLDPNC